MLLPLLRHAFGGLPAAAVFSPPADVLLLPSQYELLLDVPGVEARDITVALHEPSNGAGPREALLAISGIVKEEEDGRAVWLLRERPGPRSFRRAFALPGDVRLESISASIDRSVVKVVLPRVTREQAAAPPPARTIPLVSKL